MRPSEKKAAATEPVATSTRSPTPAAQHVEGDEPRPGALHLDLEKGPRRATPSSLLVAHTLPTTRCLEHQLSNSLVAIIGLVIRRSRRSSFTVVPFLVAIIGLVPRPSRSLLPFTIAPSPPRPPGTAPCHAPVVSGWHPLPEHEPGTPPPAARVTVQFGDRSPVDPQPASVFLGAAGDPALPRCSPASRKPPRAVPAAAQPAASGFSAHSAASPADEPRSRSASVRRAHLLPPSVADDAVRAVSSTAAGSTSRSTARSAARSSSVLRPKALPICCRHTSAATRPRRLPARTSDSLAAQIDPAGCPDHPIVDDLDRRAPSLPRWSRGSRRTRAASPARTATHPPAPSSPACCG